MKIGIYGGSFDPIHNAHIKTVLFIKENLNLDKVIVIPAGNPPHKAQGTRIDGRYRLEMCKLAFEGYDFIEVSDIEINSNKKSYTYQTLKKIKKQYKDDKLYFIMGADMYVTLDKWKNPKKIFEIAEIITVPRNDIDCNELSSYSKKFKKLGCETIILENTVMAESSTKIRENLYNNISNDDMLPEKVSNYIIKNKLYKDVENVMLNQYRNIIKERMSEKRYIHSINVEKAAVSLAKKYGGDVQKAAIAGILHDITKETSFDEQREIINNSGYKLSELEETNQKLWHSISGAMYVRDTLGIKDPDIINAILYHTTARANMSVLEKIIYLADYIGEERDFDGVDEIRKKVDEGLDIGMLAGLSFSLKSLVEREATIDPDTFEAYNEVVNEINKTKITEE